MIVGNIDRFSVMMDVIDEWNEDKAFNNGILMMSIGGTVFPSFMVDCVLNTDIPVLINALDDISVDCTMYEMEKQKFFATAYHLAFPDDINIDNDYRYLKSPYCFTDYRCYVFMVSNGKTARIVAANTTPNDEREDSDFFGVEMLESYISLEEISAMKDKLTEINRLIRI